MSSPYRRAALAVSRLGSIRCGAPRSWTHTSTSGQRRTSAPVAPAWSKWMWVSRIRSAGPVEGLQQRAVRGLRAGVDEDVVVLEAADDQRLAEVVDVDLAGR